MSGVERPPKARARLRLRLLAWIGALCAAYVGLSFAFDRLIGHAGLLMPTGAPPLWALALGALTLASRLAMLFVAPVVVGYWLASMLMGQPATPRASEARRRAGHEPRAER